MELTRFENLGASIRLLGGSKVTAELVKALELGVKDADPNDVVAGDSGIFFLSDEGALTRVLVNIVDKSTSSRYVTAKQRALIESGKFDDDELVESLHKYHLVRCKTIERAEEQGWRDKYKLSHRADGRFYYRFLANNEVIAERKDQRLLVCKNCLSAAAAADAIGRPASREDFKPNDFLNALEGNKVVGLPDRGEFAEQSVPNKYARDWRLIANALKRRKNFRCEGLNCPSRDLSDRASRRFLHAHHKDLDKTNNDFSNLEALCIYCHAQEPGHEHMKLSPDYRAYRRTLLN